MYYERERMGFYFSSLINEKQFTLNELYPNLFFYFISQSSVIFYFDISASFHTQKK